MISEISMMIITIVLSFITAILGTVIYFWIIISKLKISVSDEPTFINILHFAFVVGFGFGLMAVSAALPFITFSQLGWI